MKKIKIIFGKTRIKLFFGLILLIVLAVNLNIQSKTTRSDFSLSSIIMKANAQGEGGEEEFYCASVCSDWDFDVCILCATHGSCLIVWDANETDTNPPGRCTF